MPTETGLGEFVEDWPEGASDGPQEGGRSATHFREHLLPGCPPDTAEEIVEPRRVYRLVCTDPPTDADFDSVRAEHPDRLPFRPAWKECRARGLSVHATRASAEHSRSSTSKLSGRRICLVQLEPGAGYIERNGGKAHCTWWPLDDFDILPRSRCEVVEETDD